MSEQLDDIEAKLEQERPLTARQRAFVAEYLLDLNATQAAIRAGYSAANAQAISSHLVADARIAQAIERGKAQRSKRLDIKQEDILTELSALANSRVDHYLIDDDGNVRLAPGAPDNAMAAIESIDRRKTVRESKDGDISITYDVKIKLHDKPRQLHLLGRHIGMFPNKIEVTGKNGGAIEHVTRIEQVIVDPKETP